MFEGGHDMSGPNHDPERREPEDGLERLFAAEEALIADAGFSARVVEATKAANHGRRLTLYGAGMIGFGIAAGSLSEAASRSETFSAWVGEARRFMEAPQVPQGFEMGDAGLIFLAGAIGLVFSVVALVAQAR